MKIFIEAIDIAIWDTIENGPYIPMDEESDGKRERHWSKWSDDEKKRAQYDYRAKNIITSTLSLDEFFRIFQCKSSKEMWDTLQVTHEGTNDVKRSRKHTLINNIYMLYLEHSITISNTKCLITKEDNVWLWHRRTAYIHMNHLNKLSIEELVVGLPKLKFRKDKLCDSYQKGKQVKVSFKSKNMISTSRPLQLIHMDLFGLSRTMSLGGNSYGLVMVDDYSRFTWLMFLATKSEAFNAFKKFAKLVQNEKNTNIILIRSDHGEEFQNVLFKLDESRIITRNKARLVAKGCRHPISSGGKQTTR
uniref:Retrovirus-related Pol polyprotein from transposon TNT 1-94 n=1 Tax=Cajanus cajan TaxID=3821 RepID=A0A151SZS5_CAJCA|nr:Retrovirus-related Pol polyprotein from transposon TNT 1-94 [Cajanus cajan]